ncbi:hypothetical protein V6N13_025534 [Hibiscus sabdariffa]
MLCTRTLAGLMSVDLNHSGEQSVAFLSDFDWRKLFSGSDTQSLSFFPLLKKDGSLFIQPPKNVFEEGIKDQKFSLVGQFIGGAPNFGALQKIIRLLWGKSTMAKWEPNLAKLDFDLDRMPVWIQLYIVPLELYTKYGLIYISSALGNPPYMDSIIASKQRLEFTKVCIELEANATVIDSIEVILPYGNLVSVKVKVPLMPPSYQKYKLYRHWGKYLNIAILVDQAIEVVAEHDAKIDVTQTLHANQNDDHVADIGPIDVEINHVKDHTIKVVVQCDANSDVTVEIHVEDHTIVAKRDANSDVYVLDEIHGAKEFLTLQALAQKEKGERETS